MGNCKIAKESVVEYHVFLFLESSSLRTGIIMIHHTRSMYKANQWPESYLLFSPLPTFDAASQPKGKRRKDA